MSVEYRSWGREVRATGRRLSGIVLPYEVEATGLGFRERFRAGAFALADDADVVLNVQHRRDRVLSRTGAGMVLTDGPSSLSMTAELPSTREADDVLELVGRGILRGLSVEFIPRRVREDGGVRVVESADLLGVAVVDRPAYAPATVGVRSARRALLWL